MTEELVTKHEVYENRASFKVFVEIDENLLKSEFISEKGDFYGVWIDENFYDALDPNTLEEWINQYGDACWASLQGFKNGETLSLSTLGEKANDLSREDLSL